MREREGEGEARQCLYVVIERQERREVSGRRKHHKKREWSGWERKTRSWVSMGAARTS